ncbi:hypothetical protein P7C71_g2858, partial [Lecanoromycetidae sp. Uapishka_2]
MDEIVPRLYVGGAGAAEDLAMLTVNKVSFVLTIKELSPRADVKEAYRAKGMEHLHIRKGDTASEDVISILGPLCDVIEGRMAKGKVVLVHCEMGRRRSITIVIAYVMRSLKLTASEATEFVKSKRPSINPNQGFLDQLETWSICDYGPRPRTQNVAHEEATPTNSKDGKETEETTEDSTEISDILCLENAAEEEKAIKLKDKKEAEEMTHNAKQESHMLCLEDSVEEVNHKQKPTAQPGSNSGNKKQTESQEAQPEETQRRIDHMLPIDDQNVREHPNSDSQNTASTNAEHEKKNGIEKEGVVGLSRQARRAMERVKAKAMKKMSKKD